MSARIRQLGHAVSGDAGKTVVFLTDLLRSTFVIGPSLWADGRC